MLSSPRELRSRPALDGQDQIALANLRLAEKELVVAKESLSNTSIPILSIVGSEDPAMEAVLEFRNVVPTMELVVIEGASHLSTPGRPEFVRSIQDFLGRNRLK